MEYDFKKIEKKYQKKWEENKIYEPDLDSPNEPFYNLMMFPYPSAEGLHVGNMYAFVGSDIYGRFKRMQGYDVFEPMGLDGFGIHSENYALKINTHPMELSKKSENHFYNQLKMIGNSFAWDEKIETYQPQYYKWTQWIFKQMFEHNLAYRKKSPVNWCPSCKTVLADEQVIAGKCERCESNIERKDLAQWFFKITNYADKLLDNLKNIDWSEKIKIAQKNWIGRSYGSSLKFKIENFEEEIEVFTTRPDTLFGATYVVLAPEHQLIEKIKKEAENSTEIKTYVKKSINKTEQERREEEKEKTGVLINGIKAINPINNKKIPIYIADYVLSNYGTGSIMAVPAHDKRDWEFAKKHNIEIIQVIKPKNKNIEEKLYEGEGLLINSEKFNGMESKKAGEKITEETNGKLKTNYRLRDWLISRQRYWGPPIPIIYCNKCWEKLSDEEKKIMKEGVDYTEIENKKYIIHTVPEKDLPVELPYIKNFRPTGTKKSPLDTVESFRKTKCPKCNNDAYRETDVSDTFLDSSWYYLKYINPKSKNFIDKNRIKKWLPVNMYTGGAEHAVLHLLYTRFVTKALNDWGIIDFNEPFDCFRAHGLLIKEGHKMSKSKGNIINPDEYIKKYGSDVLRTYLMFLAPFKDGGDFQDGGIKGITKFLNKIWNKFHEIKLIKKDIHQKIVHQTIKNVSEDIENLKYNTAISKLMVLLNEIEEKDISRETSEIFLKLLAPFAPHLTEELWGRLGNKESIHLSVWPKSNKDIIKENDFNLIIQVNGKVRDIINIQKDITEKEAKQIALKSEKIIKHINNKKINKTIFVKNKLINFVI